MRRETWGPDRETPTLFCDPRPRPCDSHPSPAGPLPPNPCPGLCPGPGPATEPFPPSLSLLSSFSAPHPSFWSTARVRESLPADVTLSCLTNSEETVDMILCPRPSAHPLIYTLWRRVLGPLNAVAACVHSKPKNGLLPSSSEELQRANYLANTAAMSQSSSESDLTWPPLPLGTIDLHIRAYFLAAAIKAVLVARGSPFFGLFRGFVGTLLLWVLFWLAYS